MELREYLAVLGRRWWQVVLAALVTLGVAMGVSALLPPRYESQVMLRVTPAAAPQTTYEAIRTAELLAKTYRELISSDYVAIDAMKRLGESGSVERFKRKVAVELIPDTEIVRITATEDAPDRARRIAEAVAEASISYVQSSERKDRVTVAVPALTPLKPAWPQPRVSAVAGLVFGLALGVAMALSFDYLGARIERASEIEEKVGLQVIGQIPRLAGAGQHANVFAEPHNPLAEHFRHLRTSVLYSMDGQKLDTLLVTSAEPRQGKTAVASNLAVSLAKTGKRILLVDADMRVPTVHEFFSMPNDVGLADFLAGKLPFDDVLRRSGFEALSVVTAGPRPDEPSELLGSMRMSEFLRHAHGVADLTIIDSPPALTVTDSVILAARVDGVLLVVDRRQRLETVRRVKAQLGQVGAHVVGVAFNRADIERASQKSSYYYYVAPGPDTPADRGPQP